MPIANRPSFRLQNKSQRNLSLQKAAVRNKSERSGGLAIQPSSLEPSCRKIVLLNSTNASACRAPSQSMGGCCSNVTRGTNLGLKLLRSMPSARTLLIPSTRKVAKYREDISSDSFGVKSDHWWEDSSELIEKSNADNSVRHVRGYTKHYQKGAYPILLPKAPPLLAEDEPGHQPKNKTCLDQTLHEPCTLKIIDSRSVHTALSCRTNTAPLDQSGVLEEDDQDNGTTIQANDTNEEDKVETKGACESSTPQAQLISTLQDESTTKSTKVCKELSQTLPRRRSPKRTRSLDCFLAPNQIAMQESISSIRIFGNL